MWPGRSTCCTPWPRDPRRLTTPVSDAKVRAPFHGQGDPVTTRREFIGTLAGSLLAAPLAAEAQQAAKIARIGYLATNLAGLPPLHEAFRQGLRDLGYVEGRNVVIEYRDAEGKLERLPALAAELVGAPTVIIPSPPPPPPRPPARRGGPAPPPFFCLCGARGGGGGAPPRPGGAGGKGGGFCPPTLGRP